MAAALRAYQLSDRGGQRELPVDQGGCHDLTFLCWWLRNRTLSMRSHAIGTDWQQSLGLWGMMGGILLSAFEWQMLSGTSIHPRVNKSCRCSLFHSVARSISVQACDASSALELSLNSSSPLCYGPSQLMALWKTTLIGLHYFPQRWQM